MQFRLPALTRGAKKKIYYKQSHFAAPFAPQPSALSDKSWSVMTSSLVMLCLILFSVLRVPTTHQVVSPIISPLKPLAPLASKTKGYEVFGFAPYWNLDKLDDVDFTTLTTFAYFGVPVDSEGNLVEDDAGYTDFISPQATELFARAHKNGTRVLLTLTQMDNSTIESFLDNPDAQANAITQIIGTVKQRGIDGINVDFEYSGTPDYSYRTAFNLFMHHLTTSMHQQLPGSRVTISVYASSASSNTKLYDIASLGSTVDQVFMMAYDFAVAGSDYAQPTAPLYGEKQGKYSYDVSTAVEQFLRVMPADKLVLGVPYYGYNYPVYQPNVNAATLPYWEADATAQTYDYATANVTPSADGVAAYKTGWDPVGKVGYRAYLDAATGTWRMIFLEDTRSLGLKYDFAKSKNLAGVGIWALGNDHGHQELWNLLRQKFGDKLAFDTTGVFTTN